METPTFTKREDRPYDYQEMTWGKFIQLREWAKKTAQELGYPIYLVGSVLEKEVPRDFDVVMTIPEKEFEERFGTLTEANFGEILVESFKAYVKQYFECEETLGQCGHVPLDFKVYPDNWFPDEDRLLLGEPQTEKIKYLEQEIEKWRKVNQDLVSAYSNRNERLREALKFYADKERYEEWDKDSDLTEYIHDIDFDGGDIAREALGISQTEND